MRRVRQARHRRAVAYSDLLAYPSGHYGRKEVQERIARLHDQVLESEDHLYLLLAVDIDVGIQIITH